MSRLEPVASGDAGLKIFLLNRTLMALHGLAQLVRSVKNRRKISSMRDFDDAQLADIGLHRSDIEEALRGALGDNPYAYLYRARQERVRGMRSF